MPRFAVVAEVTISIHTYVDGVDTADEALEIAEGREMHSLCFQCGGDETVNAEWCTAGELDGTPVKLRAEEA